MVCCCYLDELAKALDHGRREHFDNLREARSDLLLEHGSDDTHDAVLELVGDLALRLKERVKQVGHLLLDRRTQLVDSALHGTPRRSHRAADHSVDGLEDLVADGAAHTPATDNLAVDLVHDLVVNLCGDEIRNDLLLRATIAPPAPASELPACLADGHAERTLVHALTVVESVAATAAHLEHLDPLLLLLSVLGRNVVAASSRVLHLKCVVGVLLGRRKAVHLHV